MPDAGRLTQDRLPHASPIVAPAYPAPPWALPGARILKVAFETAIDPVLDMLPPRLTRSAPPYAVITVAQYPESPVGPFSLATQCIGCRAGFFIRAYALQAVVDNPAALSGLREVWGVPAKLGQVSLTADANAVSARVSCDGNVVVEVALAEAEPIDADSLRLDPVLNLRITPSLQKGKPHESVQLVQIDPEYAIREPVRGRGSVRYPESSDADPWHMLPVLNVISAVFCTADTEMPLARFVMPY
jgi:acetoacetate decarboxylase